MRDYLKRLAELAVAGFVAGAGEEIVTDGFDLSAAGLKGLVVAGLLAAYGVVVKKLGDDRQRPTIK